MSLSESWKIWITLLLVCLAITCPLIYFNQKAFEESCKGKQGHILYINKDKLCISSDGRILF